MSSLSKITKALMQDPKGILAADESTKSACKRFCQLKIPCTNETRRQWRQLLFTSPNLGHYISGVILYDETIHQDTDQNINFAKFLTSLGIIPGIKVDTGLVPLDNFEPETITEGLDGLSKRLSDYYQMGARFTKWRSAFQIDRNLPSKIAIDSNLHIMCRYAGITQAAKMVPIVEPEVLYDGDHTIEQAANITELVLKALFQLLQAYKIDLTGTILKTSMVLAGKQNQLSTPEEVAKYTLKVLNSAVPKQLAGIVFLSGGQSPQQASKNLNAIGLSGKQPWPITYSYSRAVQDPVMKLWQGKDQNIKKAQKKFLQLVAQNSAARNGEYFD